jgi:hypothetical protein
MYLRTSVGSSRYCTSFVPLTPSVLVVCPWKNAAEMRRAFFARFTGHGCPTDATRSPCTKVSRARSWLARMVGGSAGSGSAICHQDPPQEQTKHEAQSTKHEAWPRWPLRVNGTQKPHIGWRAWRASCAVCASARCWNRHHCTTAPLHPLHPLHPLRQSVQPDCLSKHKEKSTASTASKATRKQGREGAKAELGPAGPQINLLSQPTPDVPPQWFYQDGGSKPIDLQSMWQEVPAQGPSAAAPAAA